MKRDVPSWLVLSKNEAVAVQIGAASRIMARLQVLMTAYLHALSL
jgi:hypothetical protein